MKIRVIGVGGCGSNVAALLHKEVGNCSGRISYTFMDTSHNSNHSTKEIGEFVHVKSSDVDGRTLKGSGGDKKTNLDHIKSGVTDFINETKLHMDKDSLILVVFSASGGSGSAGGPILINKLQEAGCTVTAMVVTDTTNLNFANVTSDTIRTLNTIGKKGSLAVFQYNNKSYQDGKTDRARACNNDIVKDFKILSVFTNGENIDIDDKDMEMFFKPHTYSRIKIPNGLYTIVAGNYPDTSVRTEGDPIGIIGRTLYSKDRTDDTVSPLNEIPLQNYKEGATADGHVSVHSDILLVDTMPTVYKNVMRDIEEFKAHEKDDSIPVEEGDDEFL